MRSARAGLIVLLATSFIWSANSPASAAQACDDWRWPVRTLSDANADEVDLVNVVHRGVPALRATSRPDGLTSTSPRRGRLERTTFEITARIVRAKMLGNGDIRAVVSPRDDVRETMVVRFHDPGCAGSSIRRDKMANARQRLIDACGPFSTSAYTELKGLVTISGVGFWGPGTGIGEAPNGLELDPALSFSGDCWRSDGFTVMLAGDSVVKRLGDPIAAATGWQVIDAGVGGCPATGEEPVSPEGVSWTTDLDCRDVVLTKQIKAVRAYHPDLVLWWDRSSISNLLLEGGEFVPAGSTRFWEVRTASVTSGVTRLGSDGATVVFIETEPVGDQILTSHPWGAFLVDHYLDLTVPWNTMRSEYAAAHPALAASISIADAVCLDVVSPCDDRIDGVPARPDGQHYAGAGVDLAVREILTALAPIAARLGG